MVRWPRITTFRRFFARDATFFRVEVLLEDLTPDGFTGLETVGLGFELVVGAFEVACEAGLQKKANLKLETTAKHTRTKFSDFNRRSGNGGCTLTQTP